MTNLACASLLYCLNVKRQSIPSIPGIYHSKKTKSGAAVCLFSMYLIASRHDVTYVHSITVSDASTAFWNSSSPTLSLSMIRHVCVALIFKVCVFRQFAAVPSSFSTPWRLFSYNLTEYKGFWIRGLFPGFEVLKTTKWLLISILLFWKGSVLCAYWSLPSMP